MSPTLPSTTFDKVVTAHVVQLAMERFVEGGGDRDEKDFPIAIVAAETELAMSLLSLTLNVSESTRRDI
jgi:hypothetical protein